eukprot:4209562-Pleurochrysis_carterae.AAC.1
MEFWQVSMEFWQVSMEFGGIEAQASHGEAWAHVHATAHEYTDPLKCSMFIKPRFLLYVLSPSHT